MEDFAMDGSGFRTFCFVVAAVMASLGCESSSDLEGDFAGRTQAPLGAWVVALDGDVVVIGAEDDGVDGAGSGAGYVYRYDGADWKGENRFFAADPTTDARLGVAVAVDGDFIAAVAFDDRGANSGSVYVFEYDGVDWIETQKLVPEDAADADTFYSAVAIEDDEIVVGAFDSTTDTGHVYVYRYDGFTWNHEQTVTPLVPADAELFGTAISLSDDVMVVGSWGSSGAGTDSGSAYVFRFDTVSWVEEQILTASDAAAFDTFGFAVAVDDDAIVVGALRDDDGATETGSAYVYRFVATAWVEEQKLTASDGQREDRFGSAVDIDGDTIAVGAKFAEGIHFIDGFAGAAYVFRFDSMNWIEEQKVADNDVGSELFGSSVAVDGDVLAIGTFDVANFAHIFRFDGAGMVWEAEDILDAL